MKINIAVLHFLVVISTVSVNGSCPSVCTCQIVAAGTNIACTSTSLANFLFPSDTYRIDLRFSSMTEIDVQFCKKMPQLKNLFIANNQISEIPINTFEDCKFLELIAFYHNKIRSVKTYTFMNIVNLKHLSLYNNEISTIESFTFMNLPSLEQLLLHNNKIHSLESNTFINMTNLYQLDLSGNNISLIKEHAFGNLTSLSNLDLTNNPIKCDCSIFPFWTWLIERASIGLSARCSDGTLVTSKQSAELGTCFQTNFFQAIIEMYMAAYETYTGAMLTLVFYLLTYPDVQKKCREEIQRVCRGKQTVTIEDRDKLRYVESTIKEVLRIAKPGPRRCVGAPTAESSLFFMITNILKKFELIHEDERNLPVEREWTGISLFFLNPSKYV